jgi:hypothetical protein
MFGKGKKEPLLPQNASKQDSVELKQLESEISNCKAESEALFQPLKEIRQKIAASRIAIDFEKSNFGGDAAAGQLALKQSGIMDKLVNLNEQKAQLLAGDSSVSRYQAPGVGGPK